MGGYRIDGARVAIGPGSTRDAAFLAIGGISTDSAVGGTILWPADPRFSAGAFGRRGVSDRGHRQRCVPVLDVDVDNLSGVQRRIVQLLVTDFWRTIGMAFVG